MVIIRPGIYSQEKEVYTECLPVICNKNTGSYGVAADIGTTTISLSLFSLDSKKYIKNITETNSQVKLGTDVMMRVMNANSGKLNILNSLVITQIADMLEHISEGICTAEKIKEMTVTGNTVMCHLFLGMDLSGMSGAPFKTAYQGSFRTTGKDTGLEGYPGIDIYVMPGVASHAGADAVSVLCSQEMYNSNKIQIAIDIGTNAEILLNNKGKLYVCSTAAGPAFEGQGISCGMRAGMGAVNGIKINKANGNIILDVIDTGIQSKENGDLTIKGICGPGLVDAVSELLRAGVLKPDGYLKDCTEASADGVITDICVRIKKNSEGNRFVFYNGRSSGKNYEITVTQKDIRSIQLAKAAIRAGTEVMLKKAGICIDNVDEVRIAGVFGKFIHPKSAVACGLYPDPVKVKTIFIGNAAGKGAAMALLDDNFKAVVEKYAKRIRHIELADENSFQTGFMDAMEFKKW